MSLRKFVSLSISFSFLFMTYSGIMLFISPKGRIANWSNWEIFGLSKTQYGNLHVTFMVLFLIGMLLHIYLNWKPLCSYFKNKERNFSLLGKEFLLAIGFTAVFFFGSLYEIPPFKQFLDFEDSLKLSWETKQNAPLYGHAELSTLKEFTQNANIDLNKAIVLLKDRGYTGIDPDITLLDIAKENSVSPNYIYTVITAQNYKISNNSALTPQKGSGFGQLSLLEVSQKYNTDLEKSLAILKERGIEAHQDSKMKELANQLNITPFELLEIIR